MKDIGLLLMGVLISVLGAVNITGNISTIHSYNRRKVKEEDVPKYGRIVGIGTVLIGISMIIAYILLLMNNNISIDCVVGPISLVGLILILYGQFKYNRGIF